MLLSLAPGDAEDASGYAKELGEAFGLAAKLRKRPRAGVVLEEPNCDGGRHEGRNQHAEKKDRR